MVRGCCYRTFGTQCAVATCTALTLGQSHRAAWFQQYVEVVSFAFVAAVAAVSHAVMAVASAVASAAADAVLADQAWSHHPCRPCLHLPHHAMSAARHALLLRARPCWSLDGAWK